MPHFPNTMYLLYARQECRVCSKNSIVISTFTNNYLVLVVAGNASVFFHSFQSYVPLSCVCVVIILVHYGCSSELLGPHPPTIHYTLPRFILKDPWLQLLGNPQKQGVVRENDKSKDQLRAHERRISMGQRF